MDKYDYCTCDICKAIAGKLTDEELKYLKRRLRNDPRLKAIEAEIDNATRKPKPWIR